MSADTKDHDLTDKTEAIQTEEGIPVTNQRGVSQTGMKRKAVESIDISALGESEVYYQYQIQIPIKKRDLARKSPVFKSQYCGLMRKIGSADGAPEILDLGDFSPDACLFFLNWMSGGPEKTRQLTDAKQCDLFLEVFLLFDKYQVEDGGEYECPRYDIELEMNLLTIKEADLFTVMRAVMKYKDMPPLVDLCKRLLRKCAEKVHYDQLDLLDVWMRHGNLDGDALSALGSELTTLRSESKGPPCDNCGSLPCLHGRNVRKMSPNMRVSFGLLTDTVVAEVSHQKKPNMSVLYDSHGTTCTYFSVKEPPCTNWDHGSWIMDHGIMYNCKEG